MDICYKEKITAFQLNSLRKNVGWTGYSLRQAVAAVENSFIIVSAEVNGEIIGVARVISDGGYMMHIVDVIVHPSYQRKGIGSELLIRLKSCIFESLQKDESVLVTLMAAQGKESFYEKFGFIKQPHDSFGYGMALRFQKNL